jgi:Flp pilus assembly protein TadG
LTGTESGSVVIEAVVVVPVMMLLLLVVVQVALWAHAAQVVQLAASEGDRAARAFGAGIAAGQGGARVVLGGSASSVTSSSVSVVPLPGGQVEVSVRARAASVLPWLTLPVSATAVGPVQQFRSSG